MTSAQITNERIDQYLGRLDTCLSGVPPVEKADILREIRAHIVEVAGGAADREPAVERVLRLLGAPEELAGRYSTESLLTRASRSFSPWLLLRTCYRWATLGVKGTIAFLLGLVGYTIALAMTVSVILKPFMPAKIGLWVGPEGLNLGVPTHPESMHELLGRLFVPVIAVTAFAVAVGTTQTLRWMMRKRTSSPVDQMRGMMSGPAHV